MSNVMAILQDADKCMRCNGCVISCKRTWKMKALNPGVHKTAPDQRVIIKSQNRIDNGPFLRYSCWHCPSPPCAPRCPFGAIKKQETGAVSVDPELCNPGGTNNGKTCTYQCVADCGRGGYPKVGSGSDTHLAPKAWKCTMCYGRAGADDALDAAYGNPLPTKSSAAEIAAVPELAHWPSCVFTCPAGAMKYDTKANILAELYLNGSHGELHNGWKATLGDGSMWWASKKLTTFVQPKADPFIEDHVTPMLAGLSGSASKLPVVPVLVAGGLFAVMARRQRHLSGQGEG
ncbi:MAG: hypothetical protein IBX62_08910 [Coriobacteriia bacterium]|nr:hypothetical protein [Coriobacteriia bacterium]